MNSAELKAFNKKFEALLRKGKLTAVDLFTMYRPELSSMSSDKQYWVLFLTTALRVWDTKGEEWCNTITPDHEMDPSSCSISYDHTNQLIMFCTYGQGQHRANIYNFIGSSRIATSLIARANDASIKPVQWRVINNKSILFNDQFHWHEYDIADLKVRGEISTRYSYSFSEGYMSNKEEAFYLIEEIIHIHRKVSVIFIRSELGPQSFIASVRSSSQATPVSLDQLYLLPVIVKDNFAECVSLNETMLTIGTHKIDMSEFLKK